MPVAEFAQAAQALRRHRADAALALQRFDQDARGLRADRRLQRLVVAEGHLVETLDLRTEALDVFLLATRGDRREGAAMEGALEGDQPIALGMAVMGMVLAHRLDAALDRLGARIAEEDRVSEAVLGEAPRQSLAFGNAEDVGDVPQLLRLLGQRGDQPGMRMAQRGDGDAAHEVQVASAVGPMQIRALPALDGEVEPGIGGHDGRERLGRRDAQGVSPRHGARGIRALPKRQGTRSRVPWSKPGFIRASPIRVNPWKNCRFQPRRRYPPAISRWQSSSSAASTPATVATPTTRSPS